MTLQKTQLYSHFFSEATSLVTSNAIREILKYASDPEIIFFAGGLPAPETFPLKILGELVDSAISDYGGKILQYSETRGFAPFIDALVSEYLPSLGIKVDSAKQVLITSGAQGAISGVGEIFIDPGNLVAIEAPTYLGALTAFDRYQPRYVVVESDQQGIRPDSLAQLIAVSKPKFIYTVPTFQNPTGYTIPLDRRQAIAEIIQHHGVILVEDDPYCQLRYEKDALPPIQSMVPDNVVYLTSFSKVFAPGLRIGVCVAPEAIIEEMIKMKQGIDLHTSTFNQAIAAKYVLGGYIQTQIGFIRDFYRQRRDVMLEAMAEHFPATVVWEKPEGGMFVWAEGPSSLNMDEVSQKALQQKVAPLPGHHFYPPDSRNRGMNTMRLNFSNQTPEKIKEGIARLGVILSEAA